jgi:hypothetical protein
VRGGKEAIADRPVRRLPWKAGGVHDPCMTATHCRRATRPDSDRPSQARTFLSLRDRGVAAVRARRALCATLLLVATGACRQDAGKQRDSAIANIPGNEAREISIAIDRARPKMSRREWTANDGTATSALVGFYAGDTLRLIRERVTRGEQETSANRYYYDGGALRYYESDGQRAPADSTAVSGKEKTRTSYAFDAAGALVEGSRLVNDQTVAIDSVEVRGVLERAAALKAQAANAPVVPPKANPQG